MRMIDANVCFGFWPKRNIDASPDEILRRMDKAEIETALISSFHGIVNDFIEANDFTLELCRQHSDRFIPVATINPQTYFGVKEEVTRMNDAGVKLIRFWPEEQEWSVGQLHFTNLMEEIDKTDMSVMLPSTQSVTTIGAIAKNFSNNIILETIKGYPKLAEIIAVANDVDNFFIETHLMASPGFVEIITDEVEEGRMVFGTGAPLHTISSAIMPIAKAKVKDDLKADIFAGTIERILGL